ncbi:MAG TPA: hypothetical protein VK840_03910, partial [Candidatus Dormibacteraeota bacterium]|nr:hypothetical protein [Candidatus Dormibacteraeota bacterium]
MDVRQIESREFSTGRLGLRARFLTELPKTEWRKNELNHFAMDDWGNWRLNFPVSSARKLRQNHPAKMQFRMKNGKSVWNLTSFSCKSLTCGEPDDFLHDPWVQWQGRTWLCKRKGVSICEVVGYQIAEALEIPLQPWV